MAVVMLVLYVTISEIFAVEIVHGHDLDLWTGSRLNANKLIESPYMTLYLTAIVMFAISVTISKQYAVRMCMTLTFRKGQGQT